MFPYASARLIGKQLKESSSQAGSNSALAATFNPVKCIIFRKIKKNKPRKRMHVMILRQFIMYWNLECQVNPGPQQDLKHEHNHGTGTENRIGLKSGWSRAKVGSRAEVRLKSDVSFLKH